MSFREPDPGRRVKGEPDCQDCGGVGIIPPGARMVRICGCRAYTKDLEGACKMIADKICRLNPDYRSKMHAAMDERHWTYVQLVGACLEYVYERGLQMTIPKAIFFAEGAVETPPNSTCALPSCGKEFTPKFPGDKFCSQECGVLALPKRKVIVQHVVEPLTINPGQDGIVSSETINMEQAQERFPSYGEHDELADV